MVEQAVACDHERRYAEALALYTRAIPYFIHVIKHESDPRSRAALMAKANEYVGRAEVIKRALERGGAAGGASADDSFTSAVVVVNKPNVSWDSVAGLDAAKAALQEAAVLPVKFPSLFGGARQAWTGVLLYGPPGTGKTFLAKAVATEANSTFLSVSSADVLSKWVGESEKLVRQLFDLARARSPSVIFVDEIDALCGSRADGDSDSSRRVTTQFLTQMNGLAAGTAGGGGGTAAGGILVLGATNLPWALDPAVRRRFQRRIYIPLPDARARAHMVRSHLRDTPHSLTEADFRRLGDATVGYSGSDIANVVRDAALQPVRLVQSATHFRPASGPDRAHPGRVRTNYLTPCSPGAEGAVEMSWSNLASDALLVPVVCAEDFVRSLRTIKPSVGTADLDRYADFTRDFGEDG